LNTPKTSDLAFAEITLGSANHWSVNFMPDEPVPNPVVDGSNVIMRVFCRDSARGTTQLSWTMKLYAHTVRVSGSITVAEYEPRTGNFINSIPIHRFFRLQQGGSTEVVSDGSDPRHPGLTIPELELYLEKTFFNPLIECNYELDTNTFSYLAHKYTYVVTPQPESCTALTTTYNIQTSGIVI